MQREIHPHWQNEPGEQPVRITVRGETQEPVVAPQTPKPTTSVSRKPAAVFGMLMVLGTVVSIYGTRSIFPAQTPPASSASSKPKNLVVISDAGFEPKSISVKPGETITWQNDATNPHILHGENLTTVDGPLDTSPIFPGSSLAVTLAKTLTPGTYEYISQTSPTHNGMIVIVEDATSSKPKKSTAAASSAAPIPSSEAIDIPAIPQFSSAAAVVVPSSATTPSSIAFPTTPLTGQTPMPQVPVIPTTPVGAIPRNPFALNTPSYVDPVQTSSVSSATTSKTSSSMHAGAPLKEVTKHKPISQPTTGPENWIVAFATLAAFLVLCRNAMRKQAWTVQE